MFRSSSLVALLSAVSIALAPHRAAAATDDFVLAGQSNMVGASIQNEDSKVGRVTSPNAAGLASWSFRLADHLWVMANEFPCDDTQCAGTGCVYPGPTRSVDGHPTQIDLGFGTCVCRCGVHVPSNNVGGDAGRGSAWPVFAARWMGARGRSVRFVATAIGGQTLVASTGSSEPTWNATAMDCATLPPSDVGSAPPTPTAAGELYCRMLEAVRLSHVDHLRAVLWQQGESDAPFVTRAAYRAALEQLADGIWSELHVPLIVAPLSRKTRSDDLCEATAGDLEIRAATLDAVRAHPTILRGPDLDDLRFEADCAHVHDVATQGERWFELLSALVPECNDGVMQATAPDPTCGSIVIPEPARELGLETGLALLFLLAWRSRGPREIAPRVRS